jgi:hypothetical protein|tara:strand:- start:1520 stop:1792 length:273 start_codon:yes stop_codon:yes gene_type:complete
MATDILFNFYELLVENIFGSVGVSIVGIGFLLFLIMSITRSTSIFMSVWFFFYLVVMGTFYLGSTALVFANIILTIGFVIQVVTYIQEKD